MFQGEVFESGKPISGRRLRRLPRMPRTGLAVPRSVVLVVGARAWAVATEGAAFHLQVRKA